MAVPTRTVNIPKPRRFKVVFVNRINNVVNKSTSSPILTKHYYSWNVTNHMRPTISGPDLRYQAPTYDIRPRPTISGPKTKQRFRSCSKRFSPRTVSKIHEHFDQQNGTKFFLPQLCFIPFSICQVSSKIVKQRRST